MRRPFRVSTYGSDNPDMITFKGSPLRGKTNWNITIIQKVALANVLCRRRSVAGGPTSSIRPPRSLGSTQPMGTFVGPPVMLLVVLPNGSEPLMASAVSTARGSHWTSSSSPNTGEGGRRIDVSWSGGTWGDGRAPANVIVCAVQRSSEPRDIAKPSELVEGK